MKKSKNKNLNSEIKIKKSHFKRNFVLFLLILIIIGIVWLYFYTQKPADGVVKNSASSEQKVEAVIQDVPESFTGQYISFMYDNTYKLKSHEVAEKSDDVILETAYLSQSGSITKKIALTVRNLPTHILDDCPDYMMRVIKKEKYKKENFELGNISGTAFEVIGEGNFEKTIFLLHKDFLAIITLSAPSSGDEKLQDEAKTIIKSISWLK